MDSRWTKEIWAEAYSASRAIRSGAGCAVRPYVAIWRRGDEVVASMQDATGADERQYVRMAADEPPEMMAALAMSGAGHDVW